MVLMHSLAQEFVQLAHWRSISIKSRNTSCSGWLECSRWSTYRCRCEVFEGPGRVELHIAVFEVVHHNLRVIFGSFATRFAIWSYEA